MVPSSKLRVRRGGRSADPRCSRPPDASLRRRPRPAVAAQPSAEYPPHAIAARNFVNAIEYTHRTPSTRPSIAYFPRACLPAQEHNDIYVAFLEFFMDLKLDYDVSEGDGSLGSDSICPSSNPLTDLEDKDTREKLPMLYRTAMTMLDGATPEVQLGIWKLVVDKLIDRTGMSNNEFVAWSASCLKDA